MAEEKNDGTKFVDPETLEILKKAGYTNFPYLNKADFEGKALFCPNCGQSSFAIKDNDRYRFVVCNSCGLQLRDSELVDEETAEKMREYLRVGLISRNNFGETRTTKSFTLPHEYDKLKQDVYTVIASVSWPKNNLLLPQRIVAVYVSPVHYGRITRRQFVHFAVPMSIQYIPFNEISIHDLQKDIAPFKARSRIDYLNHLRGTHHRISVPNDKLDKVVAVVIFQRMRLDVYKELKRKAKWIGKN